MKVSATVARYLLGFAFTVFGLNGFFHFIPQPPPASPFAIQYMTAVSVTHYMVLIFALQLVSGLLLLAGRFVPLALTVLAAIITNILLFHITMDPKGIGPGVFMAVLWLIVFSRDYASFRPLFTAKSAPSAA